MNTAAPFSMPLSVPSMVDALKADGYFILSTALKDEVEIRNFQLNLSAMLGSLREHNPGRQDYVWSICPKPSDSALATFSEHNGEANLHTDSQYTEVPEKYMSLACVRPASCGGGINFVLDTEKIRDSIRESEVHYQALQQPYPIAIPDIFRSGRPYIEKPVVSDYPRFRYRYDTMRQGLEAAHVPPADPRWAALEYLKEKVEASPAIKRLILKTGDILILDNHRVLHGRSPFVDPDRLLYRVRMDEKDEHYPVN